MYAGEGHVGGIMEGGLCLFGVTPSVAGGISDQGIAVCASKSSGPGIWHKWDESPFKLHWSMSSCYLGQFATVGKPAGTAHAAQATSTFTVARGSPGEDLLL